MYKDKIAALKKEKDALVLAHYYQSSEIWEYSDAIGDSFELAKKALNAENKIIVFCGVRFMAESAKILNRDKKVLLPVLDAGCPMADMITEKELIRLKTLHPNATVVTYVNSSASVKAQSDICCTSSNALRVVASIKNDEIIFVPDKNLGSFVAKNFPDKKFYFCDGHCPIHNSVTEKDVLQAKSKHPNALLLVHPETREEVVKYADYVGSTTGIIDFANKSEAKEFIIGTENSIVDWLESRCPGKTFYSLTPSFVCKDMKKTTAKELYESLLYEKNVIELSPQIIDKARLALQRMVEI